MFPMTLRVATRVRTRVPCPFITRMHKFRGACQLNTNSQLPRTVIILTGATATGKSSVAEYLCTEHPHFNSQNYEIVVADSVQAIRYLNIGSNKPTSKVIAAIPHHMVNIHDPGVLYSAGEYCKDAAQVIADVIQRGKVPLVVGGNTMWVDWLIKGTPNAPRGSKKIKIQAAQILSPYMSKGTKETSASWWAQACAEVDSRRAALLATGRLAADVSSSVDMTVAANDWYRLHRLLEIILTLQMDMNSDGNHDSGAEHRGRFRGLEDEVKASTGLQIDLRCFFLGGERISLYKSIDERCVDMLMGGLLEEVAELFVKRRIVQLPPNTSGYAAKSEGQATDSSTSSPSASAAIGYRQTLNYLCSENQKDMGEQQALEGFINEFATATRNYSKRQLHWYRKDSKFLWIHDTRPRNHPNRASQSIAEELCYWTYEVPREHYVRNLDAQYRRAEEFAKGEEMKSSKNNTHLLKEKFKKCEEKKSGESYILRACEGALDRSALKRYTSHATLTPSQVHHLRAVTDLCRKQIVDSDAML